MALCAVWVCVRLPITNALQANPRPHSSRLIAVRPIRMRQRTHKIDAFENSLRSSVLCLSMDSAVRKKTISPTIGHPMFNAAHHGGTRTLQIPHHTCCAPSPLTTQQSRSVCVCVCQFFQRCHRTPNGLANKRTRTRTSQHPPRPHKHTPTHFRNQHHQTCECLQSCRLYGRAHAPLAY